MRSIKLEDAISRDIGEIGTPERDKFEATLKESIAQSFCECGFAMIRRDQKTQKAYCFECKLEIKE